MNRKNKWFCVLCLILLTATVLLLFRAGRSAVVSADGTIKWVDFNVPYAALKKTMQLDIDTYESDVHIDWIEVLAYLSCKYGGNFSQYKNGDADKVAARLQQGETMAEIAKNYKHYDYYYESLSAVLCEFLGEYQIEEAVDGEIQIVQKYGLKAFSPIAEGYWYSHYDDFGNSRSYGFKRTHLGNDLIGSIGTPIIAVESGYVEEIGWNQYGGWRIGIRSFDKRRYYYYAHMRKGSPYQEGLEVGSLVKAGDVIGYLGMTGYSLKEDVNNMTTPHLHFGMQLIFNESQKECLSEIWIDVYDIVNLLYSHRSIVVKQENSKQLVRKYDIIDPTYVENME